MTFKVFLAAIVLAAATFTAAHAQTTRPYDGDVTGSIGENGRSIYGGTGHIRRPTDPEAFYNESDERGHRNTGVTENPRGMGD